MESLFAVLATGACVWLVSLMLGPGAEELDRCASCGAPVELADEAMDLVRQGIGNRLWANCTACGRATDLMVDLGGSPEWMR